MLFLCYFLFFFCLVCGWVKAFWLLMTVLVKLLATVDIGFRWAMRPFSLFFENPAELNPSLDIYRESELTKIFVEKQTAHSIFIFWSVVICKMKYTTFFFFKQLYFSIFTKMPPPLYSSLPYPVTLCNVPIMSSSNLSLFSMVTCWEEKWSWKHMRITDH